MAPSHWKAELASVVWKAVLLGRMPVEAIGPAIDAAARLPIQTVDVSDLWRGAVMRSVAARHPVYDVLFVELATREQTRVASYDRDLRKAFPGVVSASGSLLAGSRRS